MSAAAYRLVVFHATGFRVPFVRLDGRTDDIRGTTAPERFQFPHFRGAAVVDIRACDSLAIALAPSVNPRLAADEIDRCPAVADWLSGLLTDDCDPAIKAAIMLQKAHQATASDRPGPLDSVSVEGFLEYYRQHPAARFGSIGVDGRVRWEGSQRN
jgi:hypothetical protein